MFIHIYSYIFWTFVLVIMVPKVPGPLLIVAPMYIEGRTVGTLGLIIAGFGVLGEAYQFTTQLVV